MQGKLLVGSSVVSQKGRIQKRVNTLELPFFSKEEMVELWPSMIGPYRPAPRLIRWLDCNFVKGHGLLPVLAKHICVNEV